MVQNLCVTLAIKVSFMFNGLYYKYESDNFRSNWWIYLFLILCLIWICRMRIYNSLVVIFCNHLLSALKFNFINNLLENSGDTIETRCFVELVWIMCASGMKAVSEGTTSKFIEKFVWRAWQLYREVYVTSLRLFLYLSQSFFFHQTSYAGEF